MSGICYGQETKSALIFRNNTSQNNSYVDFKRNLAEIPRAKDRVG